jgi:protein-S-isoprenylcysteine O-methyltransferase Ste14
MQNPATSSTYETPEPDWCVDAPFNVPAVSKIDLSCWLSWGCYLVTFWLALAFNTQAGLALSAGETPEVAWAMLSSVVVFIAVVGLLQRRMRLSVLATRFGAPQRLTTDGPFQYTRNPIYVAFLLPLSSLALLSPAAAICGLVLYMTLMTRFVIQLEEVVLRRQFGAAYAAYCRNVPRWFGSI